MSRRQCLEQARDGVKLARTFCKDVQFSAEDASRTEINFLCEVLDAVIEAGASTLNIPDTVGFSVPHEFAELIQTLRRRVKGIEGVTISVHCHDDLGLSVANSLAAIGAGARQVECTVNGIGERAGNTSLEELVMVMRVRAEHYPYQTGVVAEELFPSSQLLSEITGVYVQPHKAIVGRNAFAHEAGIHQDGMIKDPSTYEIIAPQSVGAPRNSLVLGKHSGRNALRVRYEKLGFTFERSQLDDVYRRFVALADKIKTIEDGHLLELVRDVPSRTGTIPDSAGKTASTWMAPVSKEDAHATWRSRSGWREREGPCGPRRARRRTGRLSLGSVIYLVVQPTDWSVRASRNIGPGDGFETEEQVHDKNGSTDSVGMPGARRRQARLRLSGRRNPSGV